MACEDEGNGKQVMRCVLWFSVMAVETLFILWFSKPYVSLVLGLVPGVSLIKTYPNQAMALAWGLVSLCMPGLIGEGAGVVWLRRKVAAKLGNAFARNIWNIHEMSLVSLLAIVLASVSIVVEQPIALTSVLRSLPNSGLKGGDALMVFPMEEEDIDGGVGVTDRRTLVTALKYVNARSSDPQQVSGSINEMERLYRLALADNDVSLYRPAFLLGFTSWSILAQLSLGYPDNAVSAPEILIDRYTNVADRDSAPASLRICARNTYALLLCAKGRSRDAIAELDVNWNDLQNDSGIAVMRRVSYLMGTILNQYAIANDVNESEAWRAVSDKVIILESVPSMRAGILSDARYVSIRERVLRGIARRGDDSDRVGTWLDRLYSENNVLAWERKLAPMMAQIEVGQQVRKEDASMLYAGAPTETSTLRWTTTHDAGHQNRQAAKYLTWLKRQMRNALRSINER